ncbi:PhzF family phenazine biosynthesis protein [Spirulina subsalsa FACHB-351]|uniref:PhzF family phenazine biosynthesis protein n=2 Tax=Spirulina subsalsa TaxID=54311 RepID=A0ABT3L1C5_9CYAN|nr:PhzF family phenazine biosynthesis protein [Spirulina subsalsa FACHB-351]
MPHLIPFYIVDVFALGSYTGNPLAVITSADFLDDQQMQAIAREMNYSETTFILSDTPRSGGYDVRIFTPKQELPFAGHPTLGTAYILKEKILSSPPHCLTLNLKVGPIPVTVQGDHPLGEILWMQQNPPQFGETFPRETLAPVLNLSPESIDPRFPIQAVSTGVPFIIVPLKTLSDVQQIRLQRDRYFELITNSEAKCILVFCPETYQGDHQLNVRVFADYLGIPEDPATGSANGCLAGYLAEHNYFNQPTVDIQVEQGYEIERPSLLFLRAKPKTEGIEVHIGGQVVMIAQGELFV